MKIFVISMLVVKILLYFWCLCRAAGMADKRMEEIFKTDKKDDDFYEYRTNEKHEHTHR